MISDANSRENRAVSRIARKYELLGYDVLKEPDPKLLPEFIHDATPDIIARSLADNVVVEVKRAGRLKGSNELVKLAERVAGRPGWRFELVVLDDNSPERDADAPASRAFRERAMAASDLELPDVAYVYGTAVLVAIAEAIAQRRNIQTGAKAGAELVRELEFRGIVPGEIADRCLEALTIRNEIAHQSASADRVSTETVRGLLDLCDQLYEFV